jgi:hypothetical protein
VQLFSLYAKTRAIANERILNARTLGVLALRFVCTATKSAFKEREEKTDDLPQSVIVRLGIPGGGFVDCCPSLTR